MEQEIITDPETTELEYTEATDVEKDEAKGSDEGEEQKDKDGNGESSDVPAESEEDGICPFSYEDVEVGDTIKGQVQVDAKNISDSTFAVRSKIHKDRKIGVQDMSTGYGRRSLKMSRFLDGCTLYKKPKSEAEKRQEKLKKDSDESKKALEERFLELGITDINAKDIAYRVNVGIRNIWMVGPAGCGKTTIASMVANILDVPIYSMSCGMGTSAAEFVGYKYPEREATKFSEFYQRPCILLLDEFTALDPAVAQIANGALANGHMEITTKGPNGDTLIQRHEECIIIATSNTFGSGANPQYVANNQLDASTRDRFVGGVIKVDYSLPYESLLDADVADFVHSVRSYINESRVKRIASTRMIEEGEKVKFAYPDIWKLKLLEDWEIKDLKGLDVYFKDKFGKSALELK